MTFAHVEQLAVYYEPSSERRTKVGRLALKDRQILFEYDRGFLGTGLELSPRTLPLRAGVVVGDPAVLDGLMGVFDDSLPDGWGRLLLDRRAAELGLSARALTPLDRLAMIGARSMGALVYEPELPLAEPAWVKLSELAKDAEAVFAGDRHADLERLIAIGGSPKGARPKVLVQIATDGRIRFGARDIHPDFTAWLIKFRAPGDDKHAAALEQAYFAMARAARIEVPRTQLLGRTTKHPGYFAIERFDRDGAMRRHVHTVGGLLQLPAGYPAFDYLDLLKLTRSLTRDEGAVAELYRRACFNVLAHNRDDHVRNFAYVLDEVWRPSPAYDLTFSDGPGGEHTTLVLGEGRAPTVAHLTALAKAADLKRAKRILDEVRAAIARFDAFADEAGVPARLRASVAKRLG